jgi:Tfp pilus assembly protein PilX
MTDHPADVPRGDRRRRGERGTAFVIALLVLLVLTIAGLALTLMTQTEMRIGANEREANRTFYASDSGIQVSTARTLWTANTTQTLTILLNTTQQDQTLSSAPPLTFEDQIVVTPLYAIHTQPCEFCQVNQNLQIKYAYTTHVVNVSTTRVGQFGTSNPYTETMAQQVVASMIGIQPTPQGNAIVYHPPTGLRF